MRRILLTSDFSDESTRAFARTAKLAQQLDLGIALVHVVIDLKVAPHGAALAPPQSPPGLGDAIAKVTTELGEFAATLDGVDVEPHVLTGEHVATTRAPLLLGMISIMGSIPRVIEMKTRQLAGRWCYV
jgi:nucleotide-binding universal stress UspA family protein